MVKKRLIPVLILREGCVVQSIKFQHTNIIHSDVSIVVDHFSRWEADEIIIIDVSRSKEKRQKFYDAVSKLAKTCFVPLTVGGWVETIDEVLHLLRLGADKIVINTQAVQNPDFIKECARVCGSQCIVIAIDVRNSETGEYIVYTDRGRQVSEWTVREWAKKAELYGAGEIYLTSIEKDGARGGYDLDLISDVVEAVDIPVIAFGGVTTFQDFVDGIKIGNADAVAAANIFHYTDYSAKKAKTAMREQGIDVR